MSSMLMQQHFKINYNLFLVYCLKSPVQTNQTGGYSPIRAVATGPVNPVLTGLKFNWTEGVRNLYRGLGGMLPWKVFDFPKSLWNAICCFWGVVLTEKYVFD